MRGSWTPAISRIRIGALREYVVKRSTFRIAIGSVPGGQARDVWFVQPQHVQWVKAPQFLQPGPHFPFPAQFETPSIFPPQLSKLPQCAVRGSGNNTVRIFLSGTGVVRGSRSSVAFCTARSQGVPCGQVIDSGTVLPQHDQCVRAPQFLQPRPQFPRPMQFVIPLMFPPHPRKLPGCLPSCGSCGDGFVESSAFRSALTKPNMPILSSRYSLSRRKKGKERIFTRA